MEKIFACEQTALIEYLETILSLEEINLKDINCLQDLEPSEIPVIYEETEEGENATLEINGILSRNGPPPIARRAPAGECTRKLQEGRCIGKTQHRRHLLRRGLCPADNGLPATGRAVLELLLTSTLADRRRQRHAGEPS